MSGQKTFRAMIVRDPPKLPAFGASETKLRYDYPLLSYSGPDDVKVTRCDFLKGASAVAAANLLPDGDLRITVIIRFPGPFVRLSEFIVGPAG